VKTRRGSSPKRLLAAENRGLLLDIVVFVLNLLLMQRLTRYALELFRYADEGEPFAQFTLLLACIAMWALPAAGAVLKRWHFHHRLQASGKTFGLDSKASGCLFNPLFYFCLNLVLVSAIIAGAGQFLFGKKALQSGAVFVPSILLGLIATIVQTYLIYRYFSPPQKPPRSEFLRQRESETLGDVCIFLNMILFQIVWNFLAFADLGRPSGVAEFAGRLFFLCFVALLIYFPPRMFYLAEDIDRPRTWLTMLLANSPVIVRVLIGTKEWQ
jgi:Na+/H+ antiporter NhaD/arsenite permease-like protein